MSEVSWLILCSEIFDCFHNNMCDLLGVYVVGWYRQCSIIPYSKDVDIGIWIAEYNDRLISHMQNNGLELVRRFGKVRFFNYYVL